MHIGIKGVVQSGGAKVANATIKMINTTSGLPIKHDVLSGGSQILSCKLKWFIGYVHSVFYWWYYWSHLNSWEYVLIFVYSILLLEHSLYHWLPVKICGALNKIHYCRWSLHVLKCIELGSKSYCMVFERPKKAVR